MAFCADLELDRTFVTVRAIHLILTSGPVPLTINDAKTRSDSGYLDARIVCLRARYAAEKQPSGQATYRTPALRAMVFAYF